MYIIYMSFILRVNIARSVTCCIGGKETSKRRCSITFCLKLNIFVKWFYWNLRQLMSIKIWFILTPNGLAKQSNNRKVQKRTSVYFPFLHQLAFKFLFLFLVNMRYCFFPRWGNSIDVLTWIFRMKSRSIYVAITVRVLCSFHNWFIRTRKLYIWFYRHYWPVE